MSTNLVINDELDELLDEALSVGRLRTKHATVTQAPIEFIQRRKQRRVTELFGKIDFDPGYDYKAGRSS